MKKSGLIMEGGAMRGMFTAGVTDILLENNIKFDAAVGVSAGATFGCNFKTQQAGRAFRYCKKYSPDYRFGSVKSYLKTGNLFDVDFCYNQIPNKLDLFDSEKFEDPYMDFYAVATNVETGMPEYHLCNCGIEKDTEWVRASASIPVVSKIVNIDGKKLLDGGIADAIPIRFFEGLEFEKIVVILTQPSDYVKEKNKLLPICRVFLRKYPKMIAKIADRHIRYNETTKHIAELEAAGKIFVIRPEAPLNIKSTNKDPAEITRVYETGRAAGEKCIEALKEYLGK